MSDQRPHPACVIGLHDAGTICQMRLTTGFTADMYGRGLASWSWADLHGKVARFTSLFGDVFLEAGDGWWFLDTVEGTLTHQWDSRIEMEFTLNSPDGRDRYLLRHMVVAAQERGVVLADHEVYAFVPPPIVRGGLDADSIQTLDFVVALNICGQIHQQIRSVAAAAPGAAPVPVPSVPVSCVPLSCVPVSCVPLSCVPVLSVPVSVPVSCAPVSVPVSSAPVSPAPVAQLSYAG